MKAVAIYALVLGGGAAAGAVGMGSWSVFVEGVGVAEVTEAAEPGAAGVEAEATPPGADPSRVGGNPAEGGVPSEPAGATPGERPDEVRMASEPTSAAGPSAGDEPPAEVPLDSESSLSPAPVRAVAAAPAPAPDPDSLARVTLNYQRLARIFAAMRPDEAAPVLAQLDDSQLEGILMAMQGRNAAPILAEMDPDRAAAVSRRVLGDPQ